MLHGSPEPDHCRFYKKSTVCAKKGLTEESFIDLITAYYFDIDVRLPAFIISTESAMVGR